MDVIGEFFLFEFMKMSEKRGLVGRGLAEWRGGIGGFVGLGR
jgi:hypothetical protein